MAVRQLQAAALMECVALRLLTASADGIGLTALNRDVFRAAGGRIDKANLSADIALAVDALQRAGKINVGPRGRLSAEPKLARGYGLAKSDRDWRFVRDVVLPARGLGLSIADAVANRKALSSRTGLRRHIVVAAFHADVEPGANMSLLRNALAGRALVAVFGKRIEDKLGAAPPLPTKVGRALAGELADNKSDHATDSALVAQLAGEQADAESDDAPSLRQALIARFLTGRPVGTADPKADKKSQRKRAGEKRRSRRSPNGAAGGEMNSGHSGVLRLVPTDEQFDGAILELAKAYAEGWTGNRKAYISRVWAGLEAAHPDWEIDEADFKERLAVAHREGRIVLVNADLRTAAAMPDIQASTVRYRNAEWHFIRVIE